ncbi:MAG: hypothetical protein Q7S59_10280 [Sulfurimonas sp.]|nr:hypothetical protein [Sulfurimonas sp.]
MRRIKYIGLGLITSLSLGFSGCGDSGSATPTVDTTSVGATTNSALTTNATDSKYFRKIGDNGSVLASNATSWEMTEVIEEGLLVANTKFSESVKTYTHAEAVSYCENLSSGGYSDFKLATQNELLVIFKAAILSENEMKYFENYFQDYKTEAFSTLTRHTFVNVWAEDTAAAYIPMIYVLWENTTGFNAALSYGFPDELKKALCVRKW